MLPYPDFPAPTEAIVADDNLLQDYLRRIHRSLKQSRGAISILEHNPPMDGVTDSSRSWNSAVAAAVANGGGVITAPAGSVWALSSAITVTASNILFYLPQVTIKPIGATSFACFDFGSTSGVQATPVLGTDAAIGAVTISVSTLGALVSGSKLYMQKDAPANGNAAAIYVFITKVRSVSGSGPWTITLESALPIAFNTADTGLALKRVLLQDNCGIVGPLTFDASGSTGTTVHGVQGLWLSNSKFVNIHGADFDTGSAVYLQYGHGNYADNCTAEACGNASYDALFYIGQTAGRFNNQRTINGTGFGIQHQSCCYCTGYGQTSEGTRSGRGVKFAAALENDFYGLHGHGSDYNGVGVSIGSCRNTFHGIHANGNLTSEGLWLSDQYNIDNKFYGFSGSGNASRDIYVGATDTTNSFFGVKTGGTFYVGNDTSLVYDWNGVMFATGMSGNQPVAFNTAFADDAAAATGGIPIGGLYRTASAMKVRVA